MDAYKIRLQSFEGPLDLLLHLIKKNKMNIYEIQIAEITKQYLEYLDLMRTLDLNIASEFLVMAATLMNLKSRMLLPRPEEVGEDEITVETLVQQLLEYQRFKEVSVQLKEMEEKEIKYFPRINFPEDKKSTKEPQLKVSIFDLLIAVKALIEKSKEPEPQEIELYEIKIEDKIEYIKTELTSKKRILFSDLFIENEGRYGIVATFIALLELLKNGKLKAFQNTPFGPIWIGENEKDSEEKMGITGN